MFELKPPPPELGAPPEVPKQRECAVVSALSMTASSRETIFDLLTADDFGYLPARSAFTYLKRAWDGKVSLDNENLIVEFMTEHGPVMAEAGTTHHSVAMREVKEAATRRDAYLKILQMQEDLRRPNLTLKKILDAGIDYTDFLTSRNAHDRGIQTIQELVAGELNLIEAAALGDVNTIPFGVDVLDRWELLNPGTMNLIAGRPGSGKTALMCTCLNAQGALGLRPACYCAEMTAGEIIRRMAAQLCQIPYGVITGGLRGVTSGQQAGYVQANETIIENNPLLIGGRRMTIREFELFATQAVHEHGSKVVWLDYVQKLTPMNPKMDIRNHIMECSARIKELSQKLKVPIIPLAQFNREAEDCTPKVSHLKEAGALEEDADGIILLDRPYARPNPSPRKYSVYREERLHADWHPLEMEDLKDKLVMIVAKNRNGPCGTCYVAFNGPMMSLEKARWSWSI